MTRVHVVLYILNVSLESTGLHLLDSSTEFGILCGVLHSQLRVRMSVSSSSLLWAWDGDAEMGTDLRVLQTAMHEAWLNLEANKKCALLRR